MKIDNTAVDPSADVYYDSAFRYMLESHVTYLRTHTSSQSLEVSPQRALVYEGDLFGYLFECRVPIHLHWLAMRLSGFFSPHDFGPACETLVLPGESEVEYLRQAHMSTGLVGV